MPVNLKSFSGGSRSELLFFQCLKFFSIVFFLVLVVYHYRLIIHPFPAEIREGGELLTIKAITEHLNPFALENQPVYFNPYGIIYPSVGAAVAGFLGNTILTGRLLNAILIWFSLILIFIAFRREKVKLWLCIFGVVIFYGNILFLVTPLNRPDSLGMLFFLFSILLPIQNRFSYSSLFAGLLFCLLSFYTKQYFVIGYLILILYLFLFKSIKKAIIISFSFFIIFITSAILMVRFFECYFYNTMLSQLLVANNNHFYAITQLLLFFLTNAGITLIMLVGMFMSSGKKKKYPSAGDNQTMGITSGKSVKDRLKNLNWNTGLFDFSFQPYTFLFIFILLALVLKLGGNQGAYMTYYYQMLSFPFLMMILRGPIPIPGKVSYFFILINFFTAGSLYLYQNEFTKTDSDNWKKLEEMISLKKNIFSTEEIAALIIQHGDVPYYSGYTDTFYASTISRKFNKWFPFIKKLKEKDENFHRMINENIRSEKYDLLIINENYSNSRKNSISESYRLRDTIDINFYHTQEKIRLFVWEPDLKHPSISPALPNR